MKIDLIVFDLAGTTVRDNRDVHRVLQLALRKFDVHISLDDANAVMGIPKPVAIRELLLQRDSQSRRITEEWIDEIHDEFIREMVLFYQHDPGVGEKEGVSGTFRTLKKHGIKIAVNTGFDRLITDALLRRLGWIDNGLIDCSVTSDEVPRGRPYPDMIFKAMQIMRVRDASRVAKVGDTTFDLDEGNSAGCGLVIGVTSGAFSREELSNSKHSFLVENVADIVEIIQNRNILK
jgi:phosphonatase-like hydrolase